MEMLLTVEQAASRLHLRPDTVRDHLARGVLRGIKRGRQWRVPESALTEPATATKAPNDVQAQVDEIMNEMGSGDLSRRNAAISRLFTGDEEVLSRSLAIINDKLKEVPDTADFSSWSVADRDGIDFLEAEEREAKEAQAEGKAEGKAQGRDE